MSGKNDVMELVQVFIPGMHQKLDELNEVLEVLLEEGPNPSAIEVVYRASFSLKSLAAAFEQQEMVEFIAREFDTLLNRVRIRAEKPSPVVRTSFLNFVDKLRTMVDALAPETPSGTVAPRTALPTSPHNREDNPTLLAAIGQMSIWNFHDITNYLAKLQGYTEMLEDCRSNVASAKSKDEIAEELAELGTIQEKIADNVNAIAASISRIRMARGKVPSKPIQIQLKSLMSDLMRSTLFSRYNVSWSAGMFPHVTIEQDRTTFELAWTSLWRLLAEWQPPDTASRAMCESRIQVGKREDVGDAFPDKLHLYIWLEPRSQEAASVLLEKIRFGKQTPLVDLGGIFGIISSVTEHQGLTVEVSTLPAGHPIFCLSMPCGISQQADPLPQSESPRQRASPTNSEKDVVKPYILVVDDERDLRSLLTVKLTKMGYPVLTAESISEARTLLQNEKISMVLADLFLSQESGLDLLREVRSTWPDVAFLFMSGANEDDVPAAILKVLSMYANAFLRKPIPTPLLKETIEKYYKTGA